MARRIEVELTSTKDSDTWTWRAAGAREPKGEVATTLLYPDAKVGDVVKVEAEFHLDGIEVVEVFAPKSKKERTGLLDMIVTPLRDDELVTEVRAKKGRGRNDREGRNDRPGRDRPERKPRSDRSERPSQPRPERKPDADRKPRPTRLKPRRVHRDALVAEIPAEHKPIADQLLNGGLPAVRTAAKGDPNAKQIISIAESLAPKLQSAEWRDRAEAAQKDIEMLDLRDLRQVVVGAEKGARDDETRALAAELRDNLNRRVEADHAEWLADLERAVKEERVIRALRLTSRPVKAGSPIPLELAEKLAAQTVVAMNSETPADRWASVLDALAFSPIRAGVKPEFFPVSTDEQFLDIVRSVADRVPEIAAHYGINPSEAKAAAKRVRNARKASPGRGRADRGSGRPANRSDGERAGGGERSGGDRPKRDRKDKKEFGPKVDKGHADLLKTPSRPRPGTVIPEPEPEPEPEVVEEVSAAEPESANEVAAAEETPAATAEAEPESANEATAAEETPAATAEAETKPADEPSTAEETPAATAEAETKPAEEPSAAEETPAATAEAETKPAEEPSAAAEAPEAEATPTQETPDAEPA